jgi:DNA-binding MarR family transcriptional regulator
MSTFAEPRDLPPAAMLIYRELQHADHPLSPGQLQERTARPASTVREALRTLQDADMVACRPGYSDARRRMYSVTDDIRR